MRIREVTDVDLAPSVVSFVLFPHLFSSLDMIKASLLPVVALSIILSTKACPLPGGPSGNVAA